MAFTHTDISYKFSDEKLIHVQIKKFGPVTKLLAMNLQQGNGYGGNIAD
jgi:hypothetical protein